MWISSFTLCKLQWGSRWITNSKIPPLHEVEKLNDASHRLYSLTFPGLITIVDCQRTYLVVGLPDLLLPASNLIGSEKLSAWAFSPSSSSPTDAGILLFELSRWYTWVNFYRPRCPSDCSSDLKPMWSSKYASPLWWKSFKRTAIRKKGMIYLL